MMLKMTYYYCHCHYHCYYYMGVQSAVLDKFNLSCCDF